MIGDPAASADDRKSAATFIGLRFIMPLAAHHFGGDVHVISVDKTTFAGRRWWRRRSAIPSKSCPTLGNQVSIPIGTEVFPSRSKSQIALSKSSYRTILPLCSIAPLF